jgi:uncharacterized protein YkwD
VRRALALTVLLPALALLVTATVAAPAQAAAPYDVSLTLSKSTAFVNERVKFRGRVHTASGRDASGTVIIQKRRASGGSWVNWRTDKLDDSGVFVKRVRMTSANRTWEFRAKMPGKGADATGYSPLRQLKVKGPTDTEAKVIGLVNKQRSRRGLRPVRVRYDLTRAARAHSRDMAECRRLTHRSSNGCSVARRIRYFGYTRSGYRYWTVGENIARARKGTLSATPTAIVSAWMRSDAHRRVILRGALRDVGVGIRTCSNGYWYYTFDVGRRKR